MYARMYGRLKTDRPVDFDNGFCFSPGGYEITVGGQTIGFDFSDTEFGAEETGDVINWMQKNFDEELAKMSVNDFCTALLKNDISEVGEFFIYTGEGCDPEYRIADVLAASIIVFDDEGEPHVFDITDMAKAGLYVERD